MTNSISLFPTEDRQTLRTEKLKVNFKLNSYSCYLDIKNDSKELEIHFDSKIIQKQILENIKRLSSTYSHDADYLIELFKIVVSKIDQTIVNIIKETKVQGYEEWHKAVFETPNGTYRVYIGLKYGVGDANRLAEYIVANADEAVDIDELAKEATDSLVAVPTEEVTIVE